MSITQQPVAQRVIYPETDGEPMAETDVHRRAERAQAAEAEVERLRAELARLRGEQA